jgi:hypothetical protein
MTETVNLVTVNLETGEEKLTTGYHREELERWCDRVRKESSDGVMSWRIVDEKGEEVC